jgi:hypothetical protein
MKSNVKKLKLIEYGFKSKTVMSLNETQVNSLYNRLVETKKKESNEAELVIDPNNPEDLEFAKQKGMVGPEGKIRIPVGEEDNIDSDDALGDVAMQQSTGQETPHDEKDMAPDGMDDDSDINRKEMGEIKIKDLLFKTRKKWDRGSDSKSEKVAKKDIRKHYHKYGDPFEPDVESSPKFAIGLDDPNFMIGESETNEKFESKSQQKYFFARCNDKSLSKKERNKWCKMADEFAADTKNFSKLPEKKKETSENYLDMIGNAMNKNMKNKISDIRPGLKFEQVVEKEMERIVEKYIQPKITKQDFLGIVGNLDMDKPKGKIKTITNEQGPGIAPSKPKVKPGTKPTRPGTPYRPKPGPKPAPKADEKNIPDWLTFDKLNINFK